MPLRREFKTASAASRIRLRFRAQMRFDVVEGGVRTKLMITHCLQQIEPRGQHLLPKIPDARSRGLVAGDQSQRALGSVDRLLQLYVGVRVTLYAAQRICEVEVLLIREFLRRPFWGRRRRPRFVPDPVAFLEIALQRRFLSLLLIAAEGRYRFCNDVGRERSGACRACSGGNSHRASADLAAVMVIARLRLLLTPLFFLVVALLLLLLLLIRLPIALLATAPLLALVPPLHDVGMRVMLTFA